MEADIENSFIAYFKKLFKSSNLSAQALNNVLRVIPTRVTPAMNRRLLEPFSESEVARVINKMFPTKTPGPDVS